MSTVIRVENLSKRYAIGAREAKRDNLREVIMDTFAAPFRRFRSGGGSSGRDEDFWALRDVSFDVQEGDVVGIIGRNGAGKSTLLKILSRITEPTSGKVRIKGRVASLLEVGTGFHPELTGRENIYLNGAILGMTRAEINRKFDEIVDFSEIEKFIDTPVKRYSSGMYVRLAFAVAAHLDPEILIVDEVLAVGDAEFQKKCLGKMKDVSRGGRTVLFVSHNTTAIRELCTRAMFINNGKLQQSGDVDAVLRTYLQPKNDIQNIVDTIKYFNKKIKIDSITINGQSSNYINMSSSDNRVIINLQGHAYCELNISLEIKIYDSFGSVVGVCSPGHIKNNSVKLKCGKFDLVSTVELVNMTRGEYIFELYLLNPGIEFLAHIPTAFTVLKESLLMKTNVAAVYENRAGWGSIIFDGSVQQN